MEVSYLAGFFPKRIRASERFGLDFPFTQITLGIVDAHSGEVLAFTKPLTASKVLKDPKALTKMITKSLKKLPASS